MGGALKAATDNESVTVGCGLLVKTDVDLDTGGGGMGGSCRTVDVGGLLVSKSPCCGTSTTGMDPNGEYSVNGN